MRTLAIDPGSFESGFVVWDGSVVEAAVVPNEQLLARIVANDFGGVDLCALERVASYGMAVGEDVFQTVFWTGRMFERAHKHYPTHRVFRKDVKMFLCHSMRAKDANIRQALIDRYGKVGTKKNPGPLLGIAGHLWSALAVASFAEFNLAETL